MFLNVGFDLTEKQVRVFFDSFGQVTDVYLPKQANGRNKGFGFATFRDAEALQAALKVSAHTIGDFTVQVITELIRLLQFSVLEQCCQANHQCGCR